MGADRHKSNTANSQDQDAFASQVKAQTVDPNPERKQTQKSEVGAFEKRLSRKELLDILFSGVVALATIVSAWVAFATRQATQRQIRPYVLSKAVLIDPIIGQPISIKHTVVNYGQSPALNTQIFAGAFYGQDAMSQAETWMKKPENSITETNAGFIVPPGATDESDAKFFVAKTENVVTGEDLKRIREHDGLIVTVSRYVYQDSFGDNYGTQNCFTVSQDGSTQDCHGHNAIYGPN